MLYSKAFRSPFMWGQVWSIACCLLAGAACEFSETLGAIGEGHSARFPGRPNRKRPMRHDERQYMGSWYAEAMFCAVVLPACRPRHDKLARTTFQPCTLPPPSRSGPEKSLDRKLAAHRVQRWGRSEFE